MDNFRKYDAELTGGNTFVEIMLINNLNGQHCSTVVNDLNDTICLDTFKLGLSESFESEAYHLDYYAKENNLTALYASRDYLSESEIKKNAEEGFYTRTDVDRKFFEILLINRTKEINLSLVVEELCDTVFITKSDLGISSNFESEANHLKKFVKENNLELIIFERNYLKIEDMKRL